MNGSPKKIVCYFEKPGSVLFPISFATVGPEMEEFTCEKMTTNLPSASSPQTISTRRWDQRYYQPQPNVCPLPGLLSPFCLFYYFLSYIMFFIRNKQIQIINTYKHPTHTNTIQLPITHHIQTHLTLKRMNTTKLHMCGL